MSKVHIITTGKKPTADEWDLIQSTRKATPEVVWKHGDIGEDGLVFVQYNARSKNGERWSTAESFAASVEQKRKGYWNNRDKSLAVSKKWRENNREYKKQQNKAYRDQNKESMREYLKQYYVEHREELKTRSKEWYEANKEAAKETGAARYARNKQQIRAKAKEYNSRTADQCRARSKKWYEENKDTVKQYSLQWKRCNRQRIKTHMKARAKVDPLFALTMSVRGRMRTLVASRGYTKKSPTQEIIGCSWADLKTHLEVQFKPGMSWANRSEWHIDHRIPLCSAKTEEDLLALCKYTNLQPLWAGENLAKWTTLPD